MCAAHVEVANAKNQIPHQATTLVTLQGNLSSKTHYLSIFQISKLLWPSFKLNFIPVYELWFQCRRIRKSKPKSRKMKNKTKSKEREDGERRRLRNSCEIQYLVSFIHVWGFCSPWRTILNSTSNLYNPILTNSHSQQSNRYEIKTYKLPCQFWWHLDKTKEYKITTTTAESESLYSQGKEAQSFLETLNAY